MNERLRRFRGHSGSSQIRLQSTFDILDSDESAVVATADYEPSSGGVVECTDGLEILGLPDLLPFLIDVFQGHGDHDVS